MMTEKAADWPPFELSILSPEFVSLLNWCHLMDAPEFFGDEYT
jgi:hypothetical protein